MKILLIRPDGIGDQILSLPVAAMIRQLIPASHIVFLSSPKAAPMFDHLSEVDEVMTATPQDPMKELIKLFRQDFDAAVFLKPNRRLLFAAYIARIPVRVASGYRWHSFLANRRVYQHRKDFSKHESVYNLGLLTGLGLNPGVPPTPKLILTSKERQWAEVRMNHIPPKRVMIHPGAMSSRRWNSLQYISVANKLASEGYGVILTGNEKEQSQLHDELPSNVSIDPLVLDLMGELSLRQLMSVIGVSGVVVSGSTGPAHLAAALGVQTVSIFDPRRSQLPVRWAPLGRGIILRPDVPTCERCAYEACPYWDCLDRITPLSVVEYVHQMFKYTADMKVIHV